MKEAKNLFVYVKETINISKGWLETDKMRGIIMQHGQNRGFAQAARIHPTSNNGMGDREGELKKLRNRRQSLCERYRRERRDENN